MDDLEERLKEITQQMINTFNTLLEQKLNISQLKPEDAVYYAVSILTNLLGNTIASSSIRVKTSPFMLCGYAHSELYRWLEEQMYNAHQESIKSTIN